MSSSNSGRSLPDNAASRQIGRRVLHQGPADEVLECRQAVQVVRDFSHQGRELNRISEKILRIPEIRGLVTSSGDQEESSESLEGG